MTDQLPPSAKQHSGPERSELERSLPGAGPEHGAAPLETSTHAAGDAAQGDGDLAPQSADDGRPTRSRRRRRGGRGRRRGGESAGERDDAPGQAQSDAESDAAGSQADEVSFEPRGESASRAASAAEPAHALDGPAAGVDASESSEESREDGDSGAPSDADDRGPRRPRRRRGGRRRNRRADSPAATDAPGAVTFESDEARSAEVRGSTAAEPPRDGAPRAATERLEPEFDDDFDIPPAAAAGPDSAAELDSRNGERADARGGRRRGRRRGRRSRSGVEGTPSGALHEAGAEGADERAAEPSVGSEPVESGVSNTAGRGGSAPGAGGKRSRRGRRRGGAQGRAATESRAGGEDQAAAQGPVGVEWIPGEEDDLEPVAGRLAAPRANTNTVTPSARIERADRDEEADSDRDEGRRRGRKRSRGGAKEEREELDLDAGARARPGRPNIILVNAADREEIRVAVVESGQIVDFQMHVKRHETLVNDIYRGKVVNLEPAIGAAFIDFGEGRNGFLHTSDVLTVYGEPEWRLDKLLTHKIDPDEWDEKSSQPHVALELTDARRGVAAEVSLTSTSVSDGDEVGADSDENESLVESGAGDDLGGTAETALDVLDHDELHEHLLEHHDDHHHHHGAAGHDEHTHAAHADHDEEFSDGSEGLEMLEVLDESADAPRTASAAATPEHDEVKLASVRAPAPRERGASAPDEWAAVAPEAPDGELPEPQGSAGLELRAEPRNVGASAAATPAGSRSAPERGGRGRRGHGGKGGDRSKGGDRHGRMRARPRLPITDLLEKGQSVVVQVTKDAIGDKGPTLTTYISIPGRYLVLMPSMSRTGVSRKIEDEKERRRLKRILESLDVPEGMGVIVRTAGIGCTREDLRRDLDYLMLLWDTFGKRLNLGRGPAPLYEESDVAIRTIRDLFSDHTEAVYVDDERVYQRVREFMEKLIPEKVDRVQLHTGPKPLFHTHNVEQDFERIFARRIDLASGGSIVLDQTEALVAIDVNSGKTRSEGFDFENIALRTNLDAVKEIARQIRLRDLGGIIVCDFIDMQRSSSRRQVERALRDAMDSDRARSKLGRISQFGLLELTRQRLGPGLSKMLFANCPRCRGSGRIRTVESRVGAILRRLGAALTLKGFQKVELRAAPEVIEHLRRQCSSELRDLEARHERQIELVGVTDQLEDSVLRYLRADGREVRPGGRRKR